MCLTVLNFGMHVSEIHLPQIEKGSLGRCTWQGDYGVLQKHLLAECTLEEE